MGINKPFAISVIIPVYNSWESLTLCLEALEKQSYEKDSFEIIVIDNASTRATPENFQLPDNARIIDESEPGSYVARNTGAGEAVGEILAFTDADCIPDKHWLRNAVELYEEINCDLIGGEIEVFREKGGSKHAFIYEKYFAFRQYETVPRGNSCTANLFIKKAVFYEAGRFDPTLKSGGDWEFSRRCVKKGFRMAYGESVIVKHPARKTVRALLKKHMRHISWGSIITRKKYDCSQLRVLISNLKGALVKLVSKNLRVQSRYEKFVIKYIDFVKMIVQLYGNLLILLKLKDPYKVRE